MSEPLPARDLSRPSTWDAILADPAGSVDPGTLALIVRDQMRWSRTWLYPVARILSRIVVTLIVVGKRLLPVRLSAHATMDRLCLWFLRRFVAPDAVTLLIRHFVVETNLLNFIARNAGVPGVREVDLVPTTLAQLGNRAVIQHDVNVHDVLIDLGRATRAAGSASAHAGPTLDLTMLVVPPIDPEPDSRRLLKLDIQTALCLMNIPFALLLTPAEYRRAVHSMRLDETLLAVLADITNDPTFLTWRPPGHALRVDSQRDVPRAVYEHAVICEYAHARLRQRQPAPV